MSEAYQENRRQTNAAWGVYLNKLRSECIVRGIDADAMVDEFVPKERLVGVSDFEEWYAAVMLDALDVSVGDELWKELEGLHPLAAVTIQLLLSDEPDEEDSDLRHLL